MQFLHEASIGSPKKFANEIKKKKIKKREKRWKKAEKINERWKLIITQKKKMHATLKLNKFHSPAFAGQPDIQFQRLQWLYPQKKFLLRSTSRYTYVLCIVSKCWCSCERGILVWRERAIQKMRNIRLYLQLRIYIGRLPYLDDACVYTRHESSTEFLHRISFNMLCI